MRFQSPILALALIGAASGAMAQDLLTATPEPIAALMQSAGLQADIETDGSGDPMISSSASGAKYVVLFYGCTAGKDCTSVQLNSCFDLTDGTTLDVVNKWNVDMRYGKASVDENLDPCLRMDIDLAAGTATDTFKSTLDIWSQILGQFITTIGYKP